MSIQLADIPAAVANYLDTMVTTTLSAVTPNKTNDPLLTPGEDGTFTVTVKNAPAPDGVRLTNVQYHVSISPDTVAKLVVPASAVVESRATIKTSDPVLTPDSKVAAMFCTLLTDTTLDVDDSDTLVLEVRCVKLGDASVTCHIHADVDESDLFPSGENSPNGKSTFSVV